VATQLGYAVGILLFVPLGDVAERRGLSVKLFAASPRHCSRQALTIAVGAMGGQYSHRQ